MSKIQAGSSRGNEIVLNLLLQNKSGEALSSIELNILDSVNLKSKSSKNGVVSVPSSIPPGQSQELPLHFFVQDIIVAQTIKTTATYVPKGSGGAKLDFKFNFPCSVFMVATPCTKSSPSLSDLLFFSTYPSLNLFPSFVVSFKQIHRSVYQPPL